MKNLYIDIETYSAIPINRAGVYPYAAHPSFRVLLFAYSVDGQPVQVVDVASGETLPSEVREALTDPAVTKWAFNANFERTCLAAWLDTEMPPSQWGCLMVWASTVGLPLSLDGAGVALHLERPKLRVGRALIKHFCTPNLEGAQNPPSSDLNKWETFKKYCVRDVEAELEIKERLKLLPMSAREWLDWRTDQHINDAGIRIDTRLARNAVKLMRSHAAHCRAQLTELTGLENPNSVNQLRAWLVSRGVEVPNIARQTLLDALEGDLPADARKVINLRLEAAKSSTKKYEAMLNATCPDGRARGLLQFYGAGRTVRWAGRLIQVQNLPRNTMPDLGEARQLLADGHLDEFELLYPVADTLSQLVRTAFIPSEGCRFIVADFSAIEARVLAWLADQTDTLNAFQAGEDLYCATASRMFGVPVVKHGVNGELRQKGKIAVLACGYGGSVGALEAMGALRMGIKRDELRPLVDAWRRANSRIVDWWWRVDEAAQNAVKTKVPQHVGHGIILEYDFKALTIRLPSGRRLVYPSTRIVEGRFGGDQIAYMGVNSSNQWALIESYGPKIVENVVQAVARDLLAHSLANIEVAGHQTVMHVHDEVVVDEPRDGAGVPEIVDLMTVPPHWADGLPLAADGYECDYYQKD